MKRVYMHFVWVLLLCFFSVTTLSAQNSPIADSLSLRNTEPIEIGRGFRENGRVLRTQEILSRLESVDTTAFSMYRLGRKQQQNGTILLGAGSGVAMIGTGILFTALIISAFSPGKDQSTTVTAGVLTFSIGGGTMIGGITKLAEGKRQKVKAIELYNQTLKSTASRPVFYFRPGLAGASVGLRF